MLIRIYTGKLGIKTTSKYLAILVLVGTAVGVYAEVIDKHKQELVQLRERIGNLSENLKVERRLLNDYTDELSKIEQDINNAANMIRTDEIAMKAKQEQIKHLQAAENQQERELHRHQQALANQLRTVYMLGKSVPLRILLNQQDPIVIDRILKYHAYIGEARVRNISAIKEILSNLESSKASIATEQQQLKEMIERGARQDQELAKLKTERSELVVVIKKRISSQDEEFERLKKNEERLSLLVRSLEEAIGSTSSGAEGSQVKQRAFKSQRGKLPWPTKGMMGIAFGESRGSGVNWDGVYLSGKEGDLVEAVYMGRVVFADWLNGFGLLLIIDHGQGYMTLYGHNQSLLKKVGDWVESLEPVSQVGSSGGNSRSGIYFGIRYKGKPLDPKAWCKDGQGKKMG